MLKPVGKMMLLQRFDWTSKYRVILPGNENIKLGFPTRDVKWKQRAMIGEKDRNNLVI